MMMMMMMMMISIKLPLLRQHKTSRRLFSSLKP